MIRAALALCSLALMLGCTGSPQEMAKRQSLTFLTREGCVNTTIMRERLDEALKGAKLQVPYEVVDLDKLPDADFRRGYPTPSVLYDNADLFGLPKPTPPFPDPT